MQKKVVMIGNTAWGMHKFRSDLMQELVSKGHKVIVLAPADPWSVEIEKIGCQFVGANLDRKGTNPISDIRYFLRLLRQFFFLKPDVVLNYTIKPVLYGTLAARFAGVPQVIAITTGLGYVFSKNNLLTKITKLLYKFSLLFASQVWFLNDDDLNTFLRQKLVAKTKAHILPGEGVDVAYFLPLNQLTNRVINFTLISRMLWDKGVGIFAECAEEIKQTHPHLNFLIVGPLDEGNPEGIPASVLSNWHNKGFISYLGSVNDIRPILQNTTCLVHPTYYKEGIPRILMEANSMGVPCITTDIPGCRDVIQNDHNGFLVKPNDKDDLKKAILSFAHLKDSKRNLLSINAREKIVSNYSSERINSIYNERLFL